uniref:Pep3_Vps18 domain-containing protein n=1 Tax=Mesocestoides corti TaxID=53468 RepID=A0A5K3FEL9_MESCO
MEEADDESLMYREPLPADNTVEIAAVLADEKLRAASVLGGERHAMVATSCDRGRDFWLYGVPRALNDAPETESQSAHEFSVSIVTTRNGPTGEHEEQNKDI